MSTKRKAAIMMSGVAKRGGEEVTQPAMERLERARQAHAKGAICMEDYIWTAMQCYSAEVNSAGKSQRLR